jgi:signal transduction histidine kinase
MWVAAMEMSRVVVLRWLEVSAVCGCVWALWCRVQLGVQERRRERREQEELQAYARLDVRLTTEVGVGEVARRVSRLMAEKSAFPRTAMLVRDADGRLAVAGSAGIDEATTELLNTWAEGVEEDGRKGRIGGRRAADGLGRRVGMNGIAVLLGKGREEMEFQWAVVIPLWATGGRMMGALAVGADRLRNVGQRELDEALEPIEALAVKVALEMENAAVAERLLRAERLAGLGLLAGGAAHALSNPLTAVLGFAELIVGSTGEARVKEDAEIIVQEALRMREIVETLLEFSRPAGEGDGLMDVLELVRTVEAAWAEAPEKNGIRLEVQA